LGLVGSKLIVDATQGLAVLAENGTSSQELVAAIPTQASEVRRAVDDVVAVSLLGEVSLRTSQHRQREVPEVPNELEESRVDAEEVVDASEKQPSASVVGAGVFTMLLSGARKVFDIDASTGIACAATGSPARLIRA